MRIAPLGQFQQQFVQIEPAHEPFGRKIGGRAVDFRGDQLAGLRFARPGNQQSLKRPQHALERRFRAVGAAREQRQPSMFAVNTSTMRLVSR